MDAFRWAWVVARVELLGHLELRLRQVVEHLTGQERARAPQPDTEPCVGARAAPHHTHAHTQPQRRRAPQPPPAPPPRRFLILYLNKLQIHTLICRPTNWKSESKCLSLGVFVLLWDFFFRAHQYDLLWKWHLSSEVFL